MIVLSHNDQGVIALIVFLVWPVHSSAAPDQRGSTNVDVCRQASPTHHNEESVFLLESNIPINRALPDTLESALINFITLSDGLKTMSRFFPTTDGSYNHR